MTAPYLRELYDLLADEGLRYHLRNLVWRWFGTLLDPSDAELTLARRWLASPAARPRLLSAMAGNVAWFALLRGRPLQHLLNLDDAILDAEVIPYLASLMPEAQVDVVAVVRPYVGRGAQWHRRITWLLSQVRTGQTVEVVELAETLLRADTTLGPDHFLYHILDSIAEAHPAAACRLIGLRCERILDNHLEKRAEAQDPGYFPLGHPLEDLNGGMFDRALKSIVHADPRTLLDVLLPWLERAVTATERARSANARELWFPCDDLSHGWFDGIHVGQSLLINALIDALAELAQVDYAAFRTMAGGLEALPSWTPQHLIALAYQRTPAHSAPDALAFLLSDRRRLALGEHDAFETRALLVAIHPFLLSGQRVQLEDYILAYNPLHKVWGVDSLRMWGLDQLFLLQALPVETLSARGVRRLHEWERKFPGRRASPTRSTMEGGMVDSPIDQEATARMSDQDWMRAMRKYHGGVKHPSFLKGGALELAMVLQERTKAEPQRFYHLAMRVPPDSDPPYITAFLHGLAQADSPANWLFSIVRRFAARNEAEIKRTIAHTLNRRIDRGEAPPDDLLDLLERYVRDENGSLRESAEEPFIAALNSSSGAALLALGRALDLRGTVADHQRIWALIDEMAHSPSDALRAASLELLLRELPADRDRAVALYILLLDDHPALLRTNCAQEFLYYGLYRHFGRLAPYIRALMEETDERYQQRGAELACIAALSVDVLNRQDVQVAREMAEESVVGRAAWRRGAARIFAHNAARDDSGTCVRELMRLLDDDDEQVRRHMGELVSQLEDGHMISLRSLVVAIAASRSLQESRHHLAEFLLDHGVVDPEGVLLVVAAELDNGKVTADARRWTGGAELIRVVVRTYADPTAAILQPWAMDLFDRLMERDEGAALNILNEWDRR